ncbi:hypothetical protein BDV28DRAFT_151033 [Aspergillus coremiiformis]|uniref:Uncharacterized protein n=1 Tax=Aspergillus coremiiformis TaxID=138285 RepID=A0A5N6Z060_9EURO|nr:hypothetical protein BDV28DRAFT_151033 [Aspergillus coremiiformis]
MEARVRLFLSRLKWTQNENNNMNNKQKKLYNPLPTEDISSSSSDFLPTRAEKRQTRTQKGLLILSTSLFLLCSGLSVALYLEKNVACESSSYGSESSIIPVPPRAVTFLPHDEYTQQPPEKPGSVWDKLIPPGRGFVKAIRTKSGSLAFEEYSSAAHETNPSKNVYSISAFHQMHCLAVIYNALSSKQNSGHKSRHDHSDHTNHCIDYLRQAIMCASDATLESSEVLDGNGNSTRAVDGWNNTHQCRDWDSLYEFASRHRLADGDGIVNALCQSNRPEMTVWLNSNGNMLKPLDGTSSHSSRSPPLLLMRAKQKFLGLTPCYGNTTSDRHDLMELLGQPTSGFIDVKFLIRGKKLTLIPAGLCS